jgi:adenylosuccinate lyase
MAARLGLGDATVPGHVDRLPVVDFGVTCSRLAAVCVRLAREVVDLSRTEIGELAERGGHHYGASSMAGADMIALAGQLGRERAHGVVYDAVRQVRNDGRSLTELLSGEITGPIGPRDYIGDADEICADALARGEAR